MRNAAAQFRGRVDQHLMNNRRTAVVGHFMGSDGLEDLCCFNPAQTYAGSGVHRHAPDKTPTVAVEHRQRPEVDRVLRHAPD